MPSKGQTRFQPLIDYLIECSEGEIILTYPEIEAILGTPLSVTSYSSITPWTGLSHLYVQRWRALGWRARLDRRNRRVVFTRDAEPGPR